MTTRSVKITLLHCPGSRFQNLCICLQFEAISYQNVLSLELYKLLDFAPRYVCIILIAIVI